MNKNNEIAKVFGCIADMLSILDENPFRIRSYRTAALNILELNEEIERRIEKDDLAKIPGVGKDLANKIREHIETGNIKEYEKLRDKVPTELVDLLKINGLGAKTLSLLYKHKGVRSLRDLEKVLDSKEILNLKGFGEKKIKDIKRGIELLKESEGRVLLGIALPLAEQIAKGIESIPGTQQTVIVGALRRMKETVSDIDILTIADDAEKTAKSFTEMSFVREAIASGSAGVSIITGDGVQVNLHVCNPDSYGAALQYFSSSHAHNARIRTLAAKEGIRINEHGVYQDGKIIAGKFEKDVYKAIGLPIIAPELREDRGEIEAAIKDRLPNLVKLNDIKGDLHTHSAWSDGKATIEEMAMSAIERGYEYIAITDHSPSSRIANGLSAQRLYEKRKELKSIDKRLDGIKIFMGSEVDIRSDGTLDYPDEILKELEVVIASVHSGFKMDKDAMTERIVRALKNPYVHALGHPTGRLINRREPYMVDMDRVIETALKHRKALEINSSYKRLDLKDLHVRKAIEAGVKIIISTDSHYPNQLDFMKYGVGTARRGWVEKKSVLNTLKLDELSNWLKAKYV